MSTCLHEELQLWSGGYYLACSLCNKRWVAIKDEGDDHATDHEPRFGHLVQGEKVYRQIDRQRPHWIEVKEDATHDRPDRSGSPG